MRTSARTPGSSISVAGSRNSPVATSTGSPQSVVCFAVLLRSGFCESVWSGSLLVSLGVFAGFVLPGVSELSVVLDGVSGVPAGFVGVSGCLVVAGVVEVSVFFVAAGLVVVSAFFEVLDGVFLNAFAISPNADFNCLSNGFSF
ncbi:hypothetical protein ACFVJ5_00005, partial [Nocardia sp. NPDC127606]|uniref:hypothetical protein n=1 Tax=Nocardia sp. NPDC127606 TaxID=3345406 RepID=UPI003636F968